VFCSLLVVSSGLSRALDLRWPPDALRQLSTGSPSSAASFRSRVRRAISRVRCVPATWERRRVPAGVSRRVREVCSFLSKSKFGACTSARRARTKLHVEDRRPFGSACTKAAPVGDGPRLLVQTTGLSLVSAIRLSSEKHVTRLFTARHLEVRTLDCGINIYIWTTGLRLGLTRVLRLLFFRCAVLADRRSRAPNRSVRPFSRWSPIDHSAALTRTGPGRTAAAGLPSSRPRRLPQQSRK
jgi:hypothetical protein